MILIDERTQSISMTRGDYAAFVFKAFTDDGTTMYDLVNGDTIQLQIGKKYGSPVNKWTRTKESSSATTSTDYTIEIQPEDTKDMKFGEYFYDVSIITAEGKTYTYIGDTGTKQPKFTLLKETGGADDD